MNENDTNIRDRILTILVTLMLFISPLLYIGVLRDPSNLPRYATLAGISGLSCMLLAYFLFKGYTRIYYTPLTILVVAFLMLAGISGLWAVEPSTNLVYFVQLTSLALFFFVITQITRANSINLFLYASLFSAGISALIGLIQNYGFNIFELRGLVMGGTFTYKNHAALYFDLIIPIGFILTLVSKNNIIKWSAAVAVTICSIYIVTSHTRGSYVAMVSVLILFVAFYVFIPEIRKNLIDTLVKGKLTLLSIILVVGMVAFIPGGADKFLDRPAYQGDKIDTSTRDRLTAYSNSLHLIRENVLLGSGYGTFWKAFRPYTNHPDIILRSDENIVFYRLHNDLLQIFVELGIIGGLLFISIVLGSFILGIKLLKSNIESTEQLLLVGIMLSLAGSFVHSLVDFPLLKPSSAIQIWLYMGLISGLYAKKNRKYAIVSINYIKALISMVTIVLMISAVLFYRTYVIGGYYARLAEQSFKEKNCKDTLAFIDKAVHLFQHDFFMHKHRVNYHISCNTNRVSLYNVLSNEITWDDTNTIALITRGHIFLGSGWFMEAERDFKKVSSLFPHRPSGFIGESLVLISSGKHQEAEELLNKLIKKYPDNDDVKNAIEKLQEYKMKNAQ